MPPRVGSRVKLPNIVQFTVVIVLATVDVEFVVVDGAAKGGTRLGRTRSLKVHVVLLEHLRLNRLSVGHREFCQLVDARAVYEPTKDKE